MGRSDSLEKTLMGDRLKAGEEEDDRRQGSWVASLAQCMSLSKLWEMVKDREAWRTPVHGVAKCHMQLSD